MVLLLRAFMLGGECNNSCLVRVATMRKWKRREMPEDLSHRPHTLSTTLTAAQEVTVVELRRLVLPPLDDLLVIRCEFINPCVPRSGLDRCLCRHGVANLRELQAEPAGEEAAPPNTLNDYEPGFVHVYIKYLPQMPGESARRYLFVAIYRATRWVCSCASTPTRARPAARTSCAGSVRPRR